MSNAFAFGGTNAVLVCRSPDAARAAQGVDRPFQTEAFGTSAELQMRLRLVKTHQTTVLPDGATVVASALAISQRCLDPNASCPIRPPLLKLRASSVLHPEAEERP